MTISPDMQIASLEFELEKAERGMGMPYDRERVQQLRRMLVEARRRKLSRRAQAVPALNRRKATPFASSS